MKKCIGVLLCVLCLFFIPSFGQYEVASEVSGDTAIVKKGGKVYNQVSTVKLYEVTEETFDLKVDNLMNQLTSYVDQRRQITVQIKSLREQIASELAFIEKVKTKTSWKDREERRAIELRESVSDESDEDIK
jgi:hypothetical protein